MRLQPSSDVKFFAPLKKANVKTCKTANKPRKVKVQDKIVELQCNCNLFAKCSVIKGKRDIDMKTVVGDYELMAVPRSLMTSDGVLHSGHVGKSDLVNVTMKHYGVTPLSSLNLPNDLTTCAIIDAMYIVNTIIPKPSWIATGDDLAKEFLFHRSYLRYLSRSFIERCNQGRTSKWKGKEKETSKISYHGYNKYQEGFHVGNTCHQRNQAIFDHIFDKSIYRSLKC